MKLVIALAVALFAPSHHAEACSLSEPSSPLNHLYGAKAVIYGEVVAMTQSGYLVRRRDTIAGTHTADVTLRFSDCDSLRVGEMIALAIGPSRSFVVYPVIKWPPEPENAALITAFANAKTDAAIALVLSTHVAKGWSSYVDFPMIALFLARTPSVVQTLTRAAARDLLRDLSRHPRALENAKKALAARAT